MPSPGPGDFKGAVTSYGRDAHGNATSETSADAGPRSTQYDALGLPSQIVDALGQATHIQRDALGRPTQLSFADGKSTYLRYDLPGSSYNAADAPNASKGYLSEMQDRSGTTRYKRDAFGHVVQKTQVFPNGVSGSLAYGYNAQGLRESMTNPGGYPTQYLYDGTGRLVQINFRGVPQLTNITWNPMGQPTGWTWAFATSFLGQSAADIATSRSYDTAGRLTRVTAGGQTLLEYAYDAAGRVYSLTQQLAKPDNPADPNTTVSLAPVTWSVGYDAAGRVTSFEAPDNTAGFGYDANGNRLSSTQTAAAQTTSRSYSVAGLGNRLTGFTQSTGGTTTSVTYGYNANGDLTSDGLRSFSYDAEGRLSAVTTGATDASPTTRYVHNALGQRVFKTEPLYPLSPSGVLEPPVFGI
jgi:YD repeat-containing protein